MVRLLIFISKTPAGERLNVSNFETESFLKHFLSLQDFKPIYYFSECLKTKKYQPFFSS